MKNLNLLLASAIVIFDALAVYTVVTHDFNEDQTQYDAYIAQAEDYTEQNLIKKAIASYNEALNIQDSYDVRMKIVDLYDKGYEDNEYQDFSEKYDMLIDIVEEYPHETEPYEKLVEMYFFDKDYYSCGDYIELSYMNGIESEYINKAYDTVKHMYELDATKYISVMPLSQGYLLCQKQPKEDKDGNISDVKDFVYVNESGKAAMSASALDVSPISEDKVFVREYGNGEVLSKREITEESITDDQTSDEAPEVYSSIESMDGLRQFYVDNTLVSDSGFGCGLISCLDERNNTYNYYNETGEMVLQGYAQAGRFNDSVAYAVKGSDSAIILSDGSSLLDVDDAVLNGLDECSYMGRMFLKFSGETQYTLVKTEDQSKPGEFKCDNADLFVNGAAAFCSDGKWGFVDSEGNVIIEPQYEDARSFSNKLAAVKKDGKWGFINEKNEMLIEPVFADAGYFTSQGVCFVKGYHTEETDSGVQTLEDTTWSKIQLYYWHVEENQEG